MTKQLGPYEIIRKVGVGGMASVFLVRHVGSNQEFALKIMTGPTASEPHYRAAFWREAQSVARLSHPHIVGIYDVGIVPAEPEIPDFLQVEAPFIVMEYVPDGTLEFQTCNMDWVAFRTVLLQLLEALANAHAHGVIHRDLKPANILISNSAGLKVKISDFGISRLTDETHGKALVEDRINGTPKYMAPEQIRGLVREQGPWTDLYSLGALAWSVACGVAPFQGDSTQVLRDHLWTPLPSFVPTFSLPDGFKEWLEALLVKDPRFRCRRAADARTALLALPDLDPSAAQGPVPQDIDFDYYPTTVDISQHRFDELLWRADSGERVRLPGCPAPLIPPSWGLPHDADFNGHDVQLGVVVLRGSPFVGRRVERDLLWDEFRRVGDWARLVVLQGEQGVGKTRLAEWFGQRSHELGTTEVLRVRHSSEGGILDGLGGMILRSAQLDGLSRELVAKNLGGRPFLDQIDVDVLTSMVTGVGQVQVSRAERFASVRRFLRGLCAERAIVIIFDDLQWGPEATAFLRVLVAESSELPVLAIAIPVASQGLEAIADLVIELKPLADDELHLMARRMIHLTPSTMAQLLARIEGRPLVAMRLLHAWVLEGALEDTGDGFELRADAKTMGGDDEFWGELTALLGDDQTGTSRLTLLSAAVLGFEVDDQELEAVMRVHRSTTSPRLVARMVQLGVAEGTGSGWRFSDQAFRVFLCEFAKAANVWIELNAALAEALQAMPPRRGMKRRIATHLVEASRSAEAIDHYLEAADDAVLEGELELALELIAQREKSIERLRLPLSDERRGLTFRITATIMNARDEDSRQLIEQGLTTALKQGWSRVATELKLLRCRSQVFSGEASAAIPVLEELVVTISKSTPLSLADAYRQLARALSAAGELRKASISLDAALGIASEIGARLMIANCVWERGDLLRSLGDFDGSMASFSLAFSLYDELGARIGCGWALNAVGDLHRMKGELDEAVASLIQARQLFELAGTRDVLGVDVNLAILDLCRGEFRPARERLSVVHPTFVANGSHFYQLIVELGLVAAEVGNGAPTAAEAWLDAYETGILAANYIEPDFLVMAEIALAEIPAELVSMRSRLRAIVAFQRRGLDGARMSGFTVRRPLPAGD